MQESAGSIMDVEQKDDLNAQASNDLKNTDQPAEKKMKINSR